MTCEKCNQPLSNQEQRQILKESEFCQPRIICDECCEMENEKYDDFDYYSDADTGL